MAQHAQTRCRPAEPRVRQIPARQFPAPHAAGPHRARAQRPTARLAPEQADSPDVGRRAVASRQSGQAPAQANQSRRAWMTRPPGPQHSSPRRQVPARQNIRSWAARRRQCWLESAGADRALMASTVLASTGPEAAAPGSASAALASAVPAGPPSAAGSQGLALFHGAGAAVASCRSVILPGLPPQPNCSSSICPVGSSSPGRPEPRTTPAGRHQPGQESGSERAVGRSGALGRADHTSPPRLSNLRPRLSSPRDSIGLEVIVRCYGRLPAVMLQVVPT